LSNKELLSHLLTKEDPSDSLDSLDWVSKLNDQEIVERIQILLLRYKDPSPKYSENTLQLIAGHALGRKIIDKALSNDHKFIIPGELSSEFSLS